MKVTIDGQDFDMLTIEEVKIHNIGAPDGASLAKGFADMYMTSIVEQLAQQNQNETLHFLASLSTSLLSMFFMNYGTQHLDDILGKIKTKILELERTDRAATQPENDGAKPC